MTHYNHKILENLKMRSLKRRSNEPPKVVEQYYPSISFTFKELPEAEKWEVGEKYKLLLEVKQVSKNIEEEEGQACFEILKIKAL